MIISGKIMKVKGDWVYIKQFYSGYVYKCIKGQVKVRGTIDNPERVAGKLVGCVEGVGCDHDVVAIRIK